MESTSVKLYSLNFSETKTYWLAMLFVVGNLIFPQICHFIPKGGSMLLPIFFFTLLGAYKFGFTVGAITAILSPSINHLIFGMPTSSMLTEMIYKSILLAATAAFVAHKTGKVSLLALTIVVLFYQIIGNAIDWVVSSEIWEEIYDIKLAIPGMLLQIFGTYFILKIGKKGQ